MGDCVQHGCGRSYGSLKKYILKLSQRLNEHLEELYHHRVRETQTDEEGKVEKPTLVKDESYVENGALLHPTII